MIIFTKPTPSSQVSIIISIPSKAANKNQPAKPWNTPQSGI